MQIGKGKVEKERMDEKADKIHGAPKRKAHSSTLMKPYQNKRTCGC